MSDTPILDLERDPPQLRRSWWPILFGLMVGIALARWASLDAGWWFPLLYFSIAIHEIGHLIAAKLTGMEAGGIVVGGLMLFKSGDRWLWRFDYRRMLSGGLAKPLPKKGDFDPAKYAWMVAGGPTATILLAAVSGIGILTLGQVPGWVHTLWWLNLILCASTLLPFSAGPNSSDGARLRLLLRDPEASRNWIALLQLQTEETAGVMPRDWDPELVARLLPDDPNANENAYRHLMAAYYRSDTGDENDAVRHLEMALASSARAGRLIQYCCFVDAACCSALRGHPAVARTWLERATRLRKPVLGDSVDAAIAQSEKRYEDALRLWDAALARIAEMKLDSGLIRYSKRRIAGYQTQCREALRLPCPQQPSVYTG